MLELVSQSQRVNERQKRLGREKALRAEFETKPVSFRCGDNPAGAISGLEDAHGYPGLLQVVRARET